MECNVIVPFFYNGLIPFLCLVGTENRECNGSVLCLVGIKSGMECLEFGSSHLFHVNGEHTFQMCSILFRFVASRNQNISVHTRIQVIQIVEKIQSTQRHILQEETIYFLNLDMATEIKTDERCYLNQLLPESQVATS